MTPSQPDREAITPAGQEALEAELEKLRTSGRQAMAARILAARELGDLKENAEYHIAKDDQAHLETRIKRLRERLRKAVVVETDTGDSTFGFGRTAEVLDEDSAARSTSGRSWAQPRLTSHRASCPQSRRSRLRCSAALPARRSMCRRLGGNVGTGCRSSFPECIL